jgi:hypothetical protein
VLSPDNGAIGTAGYGGGAGSFLIDNESDTEYEIAEVQFDPTARNLNFVYVAWPAALTTELVSNASYADFRAAHAGEIVKLVATGTPSTNLVIALDTEAATPEGVSGFDRLIFDAYSTEACSIRRRPPPTSSAPRAIPCPT